MHFGFYPQQKVMPWACAGPLLRVGGKIVAFLFLLLCESGTTPTAPFVLTPSKQDSALLNAL